MNKQEDKAKPDWIIHMVANGVACEECGEMEEPFPDYICNAHTHGMEKYGHLDFQMVLRLSPQMIGYTLNSLGDMVRSGRHFKAGDTVEELFENYKVRLDAFQECGRTVLRVIIPDDQHRFPEDKHCKYPYSFQTFTQEMLEDMKRYTEEQMT